ncbi:hypothetical protein HanRHA438_Chr14g0676501 [Helianthus annuus]|nr:hypothetical protein HanIR_Chr14g0721951 [Helianthus annuus]KAJ0855726.1 hypothetical protein HanRHA438_Chr14g0676501 [Helianthus annuus]
MTNTHYSSLIKDLRTLSLDSSVATLRRNPRGLKRRLERCADARCLNGYAVTW